MPIRVRGINNFLFLFAPGLVPKAPRRNSVQFGGSFASRAPKLCLSVFFVFDNLVWPPLRRVKNVYVCSQENCSCRKPEVGLLQQTEKKLNTTLKGSFFIGDKESDIACANKYGCRPLLVKTGYGEISLESSSLTEIEGVFENLYQAAKYIEKNI